MLEPLTDFFFLFCFTFFLESMKADGDDAAKFLLGDCFMSVTEEYVTDKLESMKDGKQAEIDALQKKLEVISARQKVLKDLLYERFGNSINLDQ